MSIHRRTDALWLAVLFSITVLIRLPVRAATPPASASPPAVQRIVVLPLQLPDSAAGDRWLVMAAPVHASWAAMYSQFLEVIPLWRSMPVTLEVAGARRSVTSALAATIAARLEADWAVRSDMSQGGGILVVEFVPASSSASPHHFEKQANADNLGRRYYEVFEQFVRKVVARPMLEFRKPGDLPLLRDIAGAIDSEYGWTRPAEPGMSGGIAAEVASRSLRLARVLFAPQTYASVAASALPQPAQDVRASAGAVVVPPPQPTPPPQPKPQPVEPKPEPERETPRPAEPQYLEIEIPPPKTFYQTVRRGTAPPVAPGKERPAPAGAAPRPVVPAAPRAQPLPQDTKGFQLQVLSSQNRLDVEQLAATLKNAGFATQLEEVDLGEKGLWIRLRLTGFATRRAAEAAGMDLVARNLIRSFWVTR